jgi:hypothetical protein
VAWNETSSLTMLGADVLACKLAGLPWSSVHLSKLKQFVGMGNAKKPWLCDAMGVFSFGFYSRVNRSSGSMSPPYSALPVVGAVLAPGVAGGTSPQGGSLCSVIPFLPRTDCALSLLNGGRHERRTKSGQERTMDASPAPHLFPVRRVSFLDLHTAHPRW